MICLLNGTDPAPEIESWIDDLGVNDVALQVAKCNIKTVRLCAKAKKLFASNEGSRVWALELLQDVKDAILIDMQYEDWVEATTGVWSYRQVRTAPRASMEGYEPDFSCIYHDRWVAWAWNNSRMCRIHLHQVLLHCITLLEAHSAGEASVDYTSTRQQSASTISSTMADICSSIPFCLGDIDSNGQPIPPGKRMAIGGYLVMLPLFMVSVSAEPDMEAWARQKLEYISNVLGIRRAGDIAKKPRKAPWDLN